MTGVFPVGSAIADVPTVPAVAQIGVFRDLVAAAGDVLGLLAWLAVLLVVCFLARWRYGRVDSETVREATYDPPDLPPKEAYDTALSFGESKRPLAERLYDGGNYEAASQVYDAIVDAYESAVELADTHGFEGEKDAHDRLAAVRKARRDSRRRQQFWRFADPRRTPTGSGLSYDELIERAESAESWADKLFQDGHYDGARSEYEIARDLYTDAIQRARDHFMDPSSAESRLQTVETRLESCRQRA